MRMRFGIPFCRVGGNMEPLPAWKMLGSRTNEIILPPHHRATTSTLGSLVCHPGVPVENPCWQMYGLDNLLVKFYMKCYDFEYVCLTQNNLRAYAHFFVKWTQILHWRGGGEPFLELHSGVIHSGLNALSAIGYPPHSAM